MAHPCCICGSECYCSGDIDDIIVSKTPKMCEGCGCEDFWDDQGDDDFFEDDYEDEESELIRLPDGGLYDKETDTIHYP